MTIQTLKPLEVMCVKADGSHDVTEGNLRALLASLRRIYSNLDIDAFDLGVNAASNRAGIRFELSGDARTTNLPAISSLKSSVENLGYNILMSGYDLIKGDIKGNAEAKEAGVLQ